VDGASVIDVKQGNPSLAGTLLAVDPKRDLALLKVTGLDRPKVSMRPSHQAKVGERVFSIGAPRGLELTLSDGIVSALREPAASKTAEARRLRAGLWRANQATWSLLSSRRVGHSSFR
jgi:S1-C subfamily serine protease